MTDANKPNTFYYSMSGNREEDEVSFHHDLLPFFLKFYQRHRRKIQIAHSMNEIVNIGLVRVK